MPYCKPFNKFGLLYWQTVLFRRYPQGTPICPFRYDLDLEESFTNKSKYCSVDNAIQPLEKTPLDYCIDMLPVWWNKYNKTKHVLPKGYKEGNLQNTCFSLAGSYTFHVMANYLKYHPSRENFLDPTSWNKMHPHRIGMHGDEIAEHMTYGPKSKLFLLVNIP